MEYNCLQIWVYGMDCNCGWCWTMVWVSCTNFSLKDGCFVGNQVADIICFDFEQL